VLIVGLLNFLFPSVINIFDRFMFLLVASAQRFILHLVTKYLLTHFFLNLLNQGHLLTPKFGY